MGGAATCGITQDTGINDRSKALFALISSKSVADGADFKRRVQISVPVPIPPFNPWRGYAMPASSPYTKTPLSIPHLSAGGLDFLLEDFASSFIRRLGGIAVGGNDASVFGAKDHGSQGRAGGRPDPHRAQVLPAQPHPGP